VLVEVTFDKRVTAKTAIETVRSQLSTKRLNMGIRLDEPYAVAIAVKEAERVIQAEINWKNRRLPTDGEPREP